MVVWHPVVVWVCIACVNIKLSSMALIPELVSLTVTTEDYWELCYSTLVPKTSNVRDFALTEVHAGDRIAQLIVEKISMPDIEEVEVCVTMSLP